MAEARYPSLSGRHVLVTGGGSGIGAAFVDAFVQQGARVSFVDVVEAQMPGAKFFRCDLTDLAAVEKTIAQIIAESGPVDVLVNNAASDDRHTLEDVTPDYFEQRLAVNLRHLVFAARAVTPGMKAANRGVIINLGSISWHLGIPNLVLYETAKAGIEGLTRALARELGPSGIRVVCIVPGLVHTPRQERWHTPEDAAEVQRNQCLPVRIQPADVAALALFLSSDDARCCTGHNYWVDAGWR